MHHLGVPVHACEYIVHENVANIFKISSPIKEKNFFLQHKEAKLRDCHFYVVTNTLYKTGDHS